VDWEYCAQCRAVAVTLLAAVLMASAVALALPAPPRSLVHVHEQPTSQRDFLALAPFASIVAAIGAFVLVGGVLGIAFAVLALVFIPKLLSEIERRQRSAHLAVLARQVPQIADILAAALAAGIPIPSATQAVGAAVSEPARTALLSVVRAQQLGADPVETWRTSPEPLRPIGHALARTQQTGASVSDVLHGLAEDARRHHRTLVEVAARTAGVRAVAPLAACFLPAFLLLGVVPVVVTLADGMFQW
jgi:Flp pilus assembly protein TadB